MGSIIETEQNMLVVQVNDNTTLADIRPLVEKFVEINKNTVFDYRDKAGNKAARSHVAMLRKAKAPINDTHKRMTEEAKRYKDAVDKDRRELLEIIEGMINIHAEPIRIVEEEEKAAAEQERNNQEILDCWDLAHEMNAMVDLQSELARQKEEQDRIAAEQEAERRRLQIEVEKKEAADRAVEEARLAEQARAAKAIKEAEERERQAAADADRKIKEAEEQAAREKEEAERRVKESEERAEREKADALERQRAEEERLRQEEERARKDLENVQRVHWAIVEGLEGAGLSEDQAKAVIVEIANGNIPALAINYQWKSWG